MGGGGLYTFLFYRRHPVDAEYRRRFALTWLMAFTLMALTVWSRTAAGLSMNAVDFAVLAVHTLSVIYLVTGAVLLDGLQVGVGLWLGAQQRGRAAARFSRVYAGHGLAARHRFDGG